MKKTLTFEIETDGDMPVLLSADPDNADSILIEQGNDLIRLAISAAVELHDALKQLVNHLGEQGR